MSLAWLEQPAQTLNTAIHEEAVKRQSQLTKPPGSLGRLEDLACRLAAMQATAKPTLDRIRIAVFAADHGVVAEGVSAFPQSVTAEMVRNFARGGAAISVLARELGATLEVVDVGTVNDPGPLPGVINRRVAAGTANLRREPAMTPEQLDQALTAGREAVQRALADGTQLFLGGEMGIGNTTAATALTCALVGKPATGIAGPGTGLDAQGVARKAAVIDTALAHHGHALSEPVEILRRVGGLEIAALVGAYVSCAQAGLPVLVDGFIAASAALTACRLRPDVNAWFFYSHRSAEPGHAALMEALGAEPLLDLGMRLGEGSGAAMAVPVLRLAAALHNNMATFAEAGVSEGEA